MIELVLGCLTASVVLYVVFGGADFGAGMLELLCRRNREVRVREIVTHAMGPVWEANHIWLILAVVILFSAFPSAFSAIAISLHIPLTVMLLGIVLRGTAFSFRHYDVYEIRSEEMYSHVFEFASFLTSFVQGVIAGALLLGRIEPPSAGFAQRFIDPWWNLFSLSTGFLTMALYLLIASTFLVGETAKPGEKKYFIRWARILSVTVCACSILSVFCAGIDDFSLREILRSDWMVAGDAAAAVVLLLMLQFAVYARINLLPRFVVSAFVSLIVLGWWRLQLYDYPRLSATKAMSMNIYQAAAPEATLRGLLVALAVGGVLIFPSLFLLLKTFKLKGKH